MSLLLTNFQQTLQVVNMILLKSEQVRLCSGDMLGCQPSLIAFYSAFVAWALLFLQYQCIVWFPDSPEPEVAKRNRMLWTVQLASCGFAVIGSIIWVSFSRCSENNVLRMTGIFAGLLSSVLMIVRFAPQLITTCQLRSSGSISYITYGVIGVGGFLQTYFTIFGSEEAISTWFPVFVGNCMQTIILFTCFYFDIFQPKAREVVQRISTSFTGVNVAGPVTASAVDAEQGRRASGEKKNSVTSETELSLTGSRCDPIDGDDGDKKHHA